MICYLDQTFCVAACSTTRCSRCLTSEVLAAADKWWGKPGAPIATADFSPTCEYYVPESHPESDTDEGGE